MIFRFDRRRLRQALIDAVGRGVAVHALIAFTNRGGDKKLRELEADLLAHGVTVSRTSDDLLRYHGKMMLIDGKELYLLCFNFTRQDIDHSRSFGLVTRNAKLVAEAARLFAADSSRQAFRPEYGKLVVSPQNARKVLARFLQGARSELLIYDPQVSDADMLQLLRQAQKKGVKVRVLGVTRGNHLPVRKLKSIRLHARVILRDRREAFLGSQSLRREELDHRREVGIIFRDPAAIKALAKTFHEDWTASRSEKSKDVRPVEVPKKMAKALTRRLPVKHVVQRVVKEIARTNGDIHPKKLRKKVAKVIQSSVRHELAKVAEHAVQEVIES